LPPSNDEHKWVRRHARVLVQKRGRQAYQVMDSESWIERESRFLAEEPATINETYVAPCRYRLSTANRTVDLHLWRTILACLEVGFGCLNTGGRNIKDCSG